jgi:soluble lytic murein transglycosylase-like protein
MDNLQNIIDEASQKFGVDASLIKAVIKQESQFNPNAVSPVGAQGLMQLMPQTAELLGVTDSFDVRQNVFGGTRYLKMLLDKYNNNLPLSLAAYNAGASRVDNAGAVPAIPETQNYVLKVLQFYDDFRNL